MLALILRNGDKRASHDHSANLEDIARLILLIVEDKPLNKLMTHVENNSFIHGEPKMQEEVK